MPELTLSRRYRTPGGDLDKIAFREPNFSDFMDIGEPIAQGWMEGGVLVQNVNFEAIRLYAEKLIQAPWDPTLLGQLSIKDAKKIRDMVLGFFSDAEDRSQSSGTTSSSTEAGPPPTSNA